MTQLPILAIAAILCAGSALAQSPGTGSTGTGSTRAPATEPGSTGAGAGYGAKTDAAAKISRADSKLMADLAEANIAEIQTGKLALEKGKSDEVKKFAQHMVDDHGSALTELQTMAQGKGVKLPDDTDLQHKTVATALRALSGDTFDSQYIKRVGLGDHERTIKLLQKVQKDAKDPDLKAMASKMLPKVQQHMQMAEGLDKSVARK
jgi:putative membrane protein